MTASTIALAELAEKGADVDVLRQMVQFMAQRLMEIDVEGRCGAGYDQKSAERTNSRNGYCDSTWETLGPHVETVIERRSSLGAQARRFGTPAARLLDDASGTGECASEAGHTRVSRIMTPLTRLTGLLSELMGFNSRSVGLKVSDQARHLDRSAARCAPR